MNPYSSLLEVQNKGISGNNTLDLLMRVEGDVLAEKPDLVILMVSTNDMVNFRKLLPLPQYAQNLDSLVLKLRSTGAEVLLLIILLVDEEYLYTRHPTELYDAAPNVRITQANQIIRQTAERHKVYLLDMHAAFVAKGEPKRTADSFIRNENNAGKPDGVHPTPAGYQFMARQIAQAIRQQKLWKNKKMKNKKIICFGDSITFGLYMNGEGTITGDTYPAYLTSMLANP